MTQTTAQTVKPAKQRKKLFKASDHVRRKHFAAPLSPELRKSHRTRNLPVRSGDTVRITRGDRKGFEGKVTRVDRKKYRIFVEGLTREKVDGTTIFVPVHPSKVMITKLNLDDKWRKEILERRKKTKEIVEAAVEKPLEMAEVEEKEAVEELPLPEKKSKRKGKAVKKEAKKPGEKEVEEKEKKKTRAKPGKRKTGEEPKLG